MGRVLIIAVFAIALSCAVPVRAQERVEFLFASSASAAGASSAGAGICHWQLLRIVVPTAILQDQGRGPWQVRVRDARRGTSIACVLSDRREEAEVAVLLPVPLVAASELPVGKWPLDVSLFDGNHEVSTSRLSADLPAAEPQFRLLVPRNGVGGPVMAALDGLSTLPLTAVEVDDELIEHGDPLLFCTADAVLLTPVLAQQISEERAASLMGAGVRLVTAADTAPAGNLGGFVWQRIAGPTDSPVLWQCPATRLMTPGVVEPGLSRLSAWRNSPAVPVSLRISISAFGVFFVVTLVLMRGLFRRTISMFASVAACFVVMTGLMIYWVRAHTAIDFDQATWLVQRADADHSTGALATADTIQTGWSLLHQAMEVRAERGALVMPVFPSNREYFDHSCRLTLGSSGADVSQPTTLFVDAAAQGRIAFFMRSTASGGVLPAYPLSDSQRQQLEESLGVSLSSGWWIRNGYVLPAGRAAVERPDNGQLVNQWAVAHGTIAAAAEAWYEMQFDASHRYFAWIGGTPMTGSPAVLNLIDFGPEPAATLRP
jgi:hypothetical protein